MSHYKSTIATMMLCCIATITSVTYAIPGTRAPLKSHDISIEDVKRFSRAFSEIKRNYFKPVNDKDLFKYAIKGMLTELDPHSSYLDDDIYKNLQDDTKGEFGGLGIEIAPEDGYIKIVSPIDDTPAFRAGVKAGDLIIRLDNKPVKGMTMREALKTMRGKKGTSIILTVYRKDKKRTYKIKIVRDIIKIRSVKTRMLDGSYGYVRLSQFQKPSASDMIDGILKLRRKAKGKLRGLVLDLRNNPGGLLTSAVDVSDAFLDADKLGKNKLIVYTKSRVPSSQFRASATPGDILVGAPIVVLINNGSASGSEIVAGALQDHHRAVILGNKSFGKGSVQSVIPLDARHGMKLTTAIYYTPKGRSIQAKGIEPDITLKDVRIAKDENDTSAELISSLREKDLNKHIEHESEKNSKFKKKRGKTNKNNKDKKADKDDPKKSESLVHSDYPLHQAIIVLKGMTAFNRIRNTHSIHAKKR